MAKEQVVYHLNCPECGGAQEVEEGRTVVNCPFCGTSSRVSGEKGLWRFQVRPTVSREQVLAAVERFLSRFDMAPDLKARATIQECFVVYLPFWRAWMRVAAWFFGHRTVDDNTYPKEVVFAEDYVWTDAACDVGQFGLQALAPRRRRRLEAFDRGRLQHHALVLEPGEPGTEVLQQAENAFVERARRRASLSETRFERFLFLRHKLSLVYYPFWIVRYSYEGRTYQLVLDELKVVSGRAPGNPLLQAAALIAALFIAATLPADLMIHSTLAWMRPPAGSLTFGADLAVLCLCSGLFCLALAWLSAGLMLAGYSYFRLGSERVWGLKQKLWDWDRAAVPGLLWGLGWMVVAILSVALSWKPQVIVLAFILVTLAGLGLGWWMTQGVSVPEPPDSDDWPRPGQAGVTVEAAKPELSPLQCPNCQTPIQAMEGVVVYWCPGCDTGLELAPAGPAVSKDEGLRPIDLAFATPQPAPGRQSSGSLPFWVFDGEVQIRRREAVETTFLGREKGPSSDQGQMWQGPRRFYVPAFGGSLQDLQAWGVHLTQTQPDLAPGEPANFQACVHTEREARQLAELVFLSIETRKRDVLQDLAYELVLTSPRLLVIPFVEGSQRPDP